MQSKRRKSGSRVGSRRVGVRRERLNRPTTPRQVEILTFVRDYLHRHGYSPTYDEIAARFDITKVTVFEHLTTLEDRGLLTRRKHMARSLELASHLVLPDERPGRLRLVGRIAAGAPIEAIEDQEVIDLDEIFTSDHGTFLLEVKGDSMIDDQIADGDYVSSSGGRRRTTARPSSPCCPAARRRSSASTARRAASACNRRTKTTSRSTLRTRESRAWSSAWSGG